MDFAINFMLVTKRLQLRPCSLQDLTVLHTLWTNERIRYFLFDDRTISEAEAKSLIQISLDSFEQHHYGLWLVQQQEHPIGFAGLLHIEAAPNLVYGIHPQFCAQGYATEAAAAVLNYGLHTLNLLNVNADVDEPNTASVGVLRKLGMQQVRSATVNDRRLLYFSFL